MGFQTFRDSEFNLDVLVTQKWFAAKFLARAYNNAISSTELHANLRCLTQFYFWIFEVTCLIHTLLKSLITKSSPAYGLIWYKATITILRSIFKNTSGKNPLFHINVLLLMILVRNQITNMLGGETGKITFGRIKCKFRTSNNKNTSMVQYIGTSEGCRLWCCCCKDYDSVCRAEGFGLLLAKGCDRIAALTPGKQKEYLKLWGATSPLC